jgi:hypothetical protein
MRSGQTVNHPLHGRGIYLEKDLEEPELCIVLFDNGQHHKVFENNLSIISSGQEIAVVTAMWVCAGLLTWVAYHYIIIT